ncbi:MAG TPA: hypothetical protein VK539_33305 [Myxococcaceae bacterium]|nr:hypothetical protein [Myxococcaceae bacterium]
MPETSNMDVPQLQTEEAPVKGSAKMQQSYLITVACVVGLQIAVGLLEMSKLGSRAPSSHLAVTIIAAISAPLMLAIPAAIITAIGSIWVTKGRGALFMRSHFYLMALLIPMGLISQLVQIYARD